MTEGSRAHLDPNTLLRVLVESIRDYAILMLDPDGHVLTWNAGASLVKGYAASEIVGRHFSVFYTPEDQAAGRPKLLLSQASRDGRVEDEGLRVRKDGTRFWADVVITRLADDDGRLIGFAKVTRDLTAKKAAEIALRESEQSLNATLYSIGDAVIATDDAGRVTRINPVAARLTGWSEAEAVGEPSDRVFKILNERTRAAVESPIHRVLSEGTVIGLANHTALVARDGTEHPISDSGAPIRDSDGRVRGVVLVFRDITEERKAETTLRESEERLRLMIESVRDYAIYMLDPQGRVSSWNAGAARIKGYAAAEILGKSFSVFYTAQDRAAGKPARALRMAEDDGRFEEEALRVRKDGSLFWADVILSAMRDGEGQLIGFAKVTRDRTERRRVEQLIQDERIRTAEARGAVRDRDEFIAVAAHELRTPMMALQLKLELLEEILASGSPEEPPKLKGRVEGALKQTKRLTELIERLLDVSSIAAGRLEMKTEPFDLTEVIRQIADDYRESARSSGSEVCLRSSGPILGAWDRTRIEEAISNLLSNALKYGAGKPIDVRVQSTQDRAQIAVSDQGIGILPEDMQRIFERFQRAAPLHHYGGLGLGLYIARYIVEAHGGSLKVDSRTNAGSTFLIDLPLRPSPEPSGSSQITPGAEL